MSDRRQIGPMDERAAWRADGATEQSVARLEAVAKVMDGVLAIPGTNIRLGVDALIGLVPGIGDVISGLISSYLIWEARQHLAEARRHLDEMLGARKPETVNPPTPTESDRAAPRREGEF